MICLTWLTYKKGSCDEVSSFPALVAHTEDFCGSPAQSFAGGMLGNFQEPKLVYFPLTDETPHLVPHPCQTWLTLRTQKSTSEELFSPKDFRHIKREELSFFFPIFLNHTRRLCPMRQQYHQILAQYSVLTGWTWLWYQYVIFRKHGTKYRRDKNVFSYCCWQKEYLFWYSNC